MKQLKINHLAILACVVVGQIVPMIWYSSFSTPWMAGHHITLEQGQNSPPTPYIVAIVYSIVSAYTMAYLFKRMNVDSMADGFKTALLIGFAFTLMYSMTNNLFTFKPYYLTWIDGGVFVVVYALFGVILGAWRKYEE
jgi:hypothetical protein